MKMWEITKQIEEENEEKTWKKKEMCDLRYIASFISVTRSHG